MTKQWKPINGFPGYLVSDEGEVYSERNKMILSQSGINNGNGLKVNLMKEGHIHTRAVRTLVQEAFPEEDIWDQANTPININGDINDNSASNITMRPRWFAWKYTRQFNESIPLEYNIRVLNEQSQLVYDTVMEAGIADGVLWEYVYQSMITGRPVYPTGATYTFAD